MCHPQEDAQTGLFVIGSQGNLGLFYTEEQFFWWTIDTCARWKNTHSRALRRTSTLAYLGRGKVRHKRSCMYVCVPCWPKCVHDLMGMDVRRLHFGRLIFCWLMFRAPSKPQSTKRGAVGGAGGGGAGLWVVLGNKQIKEVIDFEDKTLLCPSSCLCVYVQARMEVR